MQEHFLFVTKGRPYQFYDFKMIVNGFKSLVGLWRAKHTPSSTSRIFPLKKNKSKENSNDIQDLKGVAGE